MGTGQLSGKPDDMLGRRGGGGVTLQVSLLSSYWEFVLLFALEGSLYTVNLFKTY